MPMWEEISKWIIKYWVEAILGLIVTGLSVCYARLSRKYKKEKAKSQAIENGLKGILRIEVIDTYEKCVANGHKISITRKDAIGDVYHSYVALCESQEEVDDTIRQLYEELVRMPIL